MARPWFALGALACVASLPGCEVLFPLDKFVDGADGSTRTIRDAEEQAKTESDVAMDLSVRDGSHDMPNATALPDDASHGSSSGSLGGDSGSGDEAGRDAHVASSSSGGDGPTGVEPPGTDSSVPADARGACQQASDCSGTTPQPCVVCPGGVIACARWECQVGACVSTTVCPAPADASPIACGIGVCPAGQRCCDPCGGTCVSATSGVACPYDINPAIVCAGASP